MNSIEIGLASVLVLLVLVYVGMHIAVALMLSSFISIAWLKTMDIAVRFTGAAATDTLREYTFGVIPLFVLMGMLVSVSGIGRDTFDVFGHLLRRVRAGLGVATVAANAVFAAITGVSIASASVFSKVAVPELIRHGYSQQFSVGVVAGSSVLGMLIPPSLLMIIYGVLSEESVGRMFIAGLLPGLLLAAVFAVMIVAMATFRPGMVFTEAGQHGNVPLLSSTELIKKAVPIVVLISLVLGGLYGGFFTPTEAGAVGAMGSLIIAILRRTVNLRKFWSLLVETGHISVSVLVLVIAASLYSRMLALSGLPGAITTMITDLGLGAYGFLLVYIAVVILLGCIIDSVSIMLIMVPIVLPVSKAFGMDPIWFGVITVVAVEIGLLTPPFGLSVFTVKSALSDMNVSVSTIFRGSFPFVIGMLVTLFILVLVPGLATWLARMI
jgi:C4-dicarboxylate transporter DctM subunit